MDPTTLNVVLGVVTLIVGQIVTLLTLILQGHSARDKADAEAHRQDELAARDRQWAIEDRKGLANNIASTLEATSGTLAAKVDATAGLLAQTVAISHKDLLTIAESQRAAQQALAAQVRAAEAIAETSRATLIGKIEQNTLLTQDVGVKADLAYNEANNVNKKIQSLTQHAAVNIALKEAAMKGDVDDVVTASLAILPPLKTEH